LTTAAVGVPLWLVINPPLLSNTSTVNPAWKLLPKTCAFWLPFAVGLDGEIELMRGGASSPSVIVALAVAEFPALSSTVS
jgi:hypothetical protein